jgi:voltage-gated potassium channel
MNDPLPDDPRPAPAPEGGPAVGPLRARLWRIIFLSDTTAGRVFDVALLWAIGISVLVVMLESVEGYRAVYGDVFRIAEWVFTIVFTIEYAIRVWVVRRPARYVWSFFGVVDLLAFLPSCFSSARTTS